MQLILDCDVPGADPEKLIQQYWPLIKHEAFRYSGFAKYYSHIDQDELEQAGRIAVYLAQKSYDPEGGQSFGSYARLRIKSKMRRFIGYKSDGSLPPVLVSLDQPAFEEDPDAGTLMDTIPDPEADTEAEALAPIERDETRKEVRDAVARLKSDKKREAISLVWFDGKSRDAAAHEMSMREDTFRNLERAARITLKHDWRLKNHAQSLFPHHVGIRAFNTSFASEVEDLLLRRERALENMYGPGAFFAEPSTEQMPELMEG